MLEVLAEGILEPVCNPENLLGPLRLIFRSEYPALVVFGLDHEYSVPGYNDVVDLRRAILRGKHDVADDAIDIPVQAHYQDVVDKEFSEPAFDLWLEKPCQGRKPKKGECKNGDYLYHDITGVRGRSVKDVLKQFKEKPALEKIN